MSVGSSFACPRCRKTNLPGITRCSSCGSSIGTSAVDPELEETRAFDSEPPQLIATDLGEWGPFRLLEKVGQGSFGEVYRAFDTTLEREVALKLLLPGKGDVIAVLREARLLARVRHPNVVPVYGVDTFEGRVGFWSGFVYGRTLSSLLGVQGRFGATETTLIGIDLCKAVSAVHTAGLLHRDIKTGNVMREEGGRILLMDFGLSRETSEAHSIAGTPSYMAPELFQGAPATVESDIYALGVLLYQLLTGKYPVDGSSIYTIRAAHESGKRRTLYDERPDLPEPLVRAVETALSPDPKDRFHTTGQMIQALSTPAPATVVPDRRWMFIPAAVLLIAALWFLIPRHAANPHSDYTKGQDLIDHYYKPHAIEDSVVLFRKTLDADPRFALAWANLCRAHYLQYRNKSDPAFIRSAQDACAQALAIDHDLPLPHVTLGRVYTSTGKTDLAAQELKVGLGLDSKNAEAWAALAELYDKQGRNADIEPTLRKAEDLAPSDWRFPNQLGTYYLSQGRLAEASAQYQQAAKLSPDNARVWNNVGIAARRQNKFAEAETALRKAIDLDPSDIYLSSLGNLLYQKGNYAAAVDLFRKSVELNGANYLAWANLASAYDRIGEKDKAHDAYMKAIALGEKLLDTSTKNTDLLSRLGSYYATVNMPDKSIPLLRQATALAPDNPTVLWRAAEGYELLHNRDEALRWIARALQQKYPLEDVKRAPAMAGLIADPRFATVIP